MSNTLSQVKVITPSRDLKSLQNYTLFNSQLQNKMQFNNQQDTRKVQQDEFDEGPRQSVLKYAHNNMMINKRLNEQKIQKNQKALDQKGFLLEIQQLTQQLVLSNNNISKEVKQSFISKDRNNYIETISLQSANQNKQNQQTLSEKKILIKLVTQLIRERQKDSQIKNYKDFVFHSLDNTQNRMKIQKNYKTSKTENIQKNCKKENIYKRYNKSLQKSIQNSFTTIKENSYKQQIQQQFYKKKVSEVHFQYIPAKSLISNPIQYQTLTLISNQDINFVNNQKNKTQSQEIVYNRNKQQNSSLLNTLKWQIKKDDQGERKEFKKRNNTSKKRTIFKLKLRRNTYQPIQILQIRQRKMKQKQYTIIINQVIKQSQIDLSN